MNLDRLKFKKDINLLFYKINLNKQS